jgi:WD40 repeat protein
MADKNCGGMARSCAYSPDGVFLAVAYGGSTGRSNKKNKEDGMIRVYRQGIDGKRQITITKVSEVKEAKQWISVVKFSPDGAYLAAGSRDNSIYIYSVAQQFKRKAKFSKHNAGLFYIFGLWPPVVQWNFPQASTSSISVLAEDSCRAVVLDTKFCLAM